MKSHGAHMNKFYFIVNMAIVGILQASSGAKAKDLLFEQMEKHGIVVESYGVWGVTSESFQAHSINNGYKLEKL